MLTLELFRASLHWAVFRNFVSQTGVVTGEEGEEMVFGRGNKIFTAAYLS